MTRARDHLLVCLHHKELKEAATTTPSEAARLLDICLRSPQLWRRLPIAALTGDGVSDEVAPSEALSKVLAGFGLDGDATVESGGVPRSDDVDAAAWRQGVDAFATRRADALASTRRAPVTTATAVSSAVAASDAPVPGATGARRGAPPAPDPGSPDAVGALWRDADTALQIGRAVHSALAVIDLATGSDDSGHPAPEVARARAATHGVGAHGDAVAAMVGAALISPTVAAAATHRHWRELFVAVPVGDGVLEGYVDLVVEDEDGLVVVDYKTDRTTGGRARSRCRRGAVPASGGELRPGARGGDGAPGSSRRARVRG